MPRSVYSLSPSPGPQSPGAISDVSLDEGVPYASNGNAVISRASSPEIDHSSQFEPNADDNGTAKCQWEACGKLFDHLPTFIEHIHSDHIGSSRSKYFCEWAGCARRGLPQTSRFALISHLRSHTGEKPFICELAECDKAFSRSDALGKHMRLQHNMEPTPPQRALARKRKAPGDPESDTYGTMTESAYPDELSEITTEVARQMGDESEGWSDNDDDDDGIPETLLSQADPVTGFIHGRPRDMVRYLVLKTKYQCAVNEHALLAEELRTVRAEEERARNEKDFALNELLYREIGPEAEKRLIAPIESPASQNHLAANVSPILSSTPIRNSAYPARPVSPQDMEVS